MIPGYGKRIGQSPENTFVIVKNRRSFAMHDLLGPNDFSTECCTDGLMAKTNTENRLFAGEISQYFQRDVYKRQIQLSSIEPLNR